MPAITRTARACALALAMVGLTATTAISAPVQAADSTTGTTQESRTLDEQVNPRRTLSASARVNRRVLAARNTAMAQRGDRYGYGATGPHAFDCSGLIYYSYRRAGFQVPRTSSAQAAHSRRVAKKDMRPGDLMFFHSGGRVYHASVFLGWRHGRALMVHAPGTGRQVQVATAWTSSWFGGTLRRR
jgi:cell wall-associated NlpC family hydrolase